MSASSLAHLAEALRSHRQHVGAGRVPSALIGIEAEIWSALSGTAPRSPEPAAPVGHRDRVLVDTKEAAAMLALSERKIRQLRSAGRLAAVVIGTAVRYRVCDLHAFAAQHKETL